jgi:hypothetical protein
MSLDKKIIEELKRFNQINKYVLNEQPEIPAPPPAEDPAGGGIPAPPPAGGDATGLGAETPPAADAAADTAAPAGDEIPEPIDTATDPDVEEIGKETEEGGEDAEAEELDITDLVTAQQEIKDKQDEIMDNLFSKLDDLESKLSHMDTIMDKINSLETKFDKYREKTPEEKLMLRSLDSYPYNQKLTDFFDDKKGEMEETGKNEYILTSDDVENFSPNELKKTFNNYGDENGNEMKY